MATNLLTEPEAATILRCSPSKVKRLRLSGVRTYIPGRPVLIDEADIDRFLAERKVRSTRTAVAQAETPKSNETAREDARAWALRQHFKQTRRPR